MNSFLWSDPFSLLLRLIFFRAKALTRRLVFFFSFSIPCVERAPLRELSTLLLAAMGAAGSTVSV